MQRSQTIETKLIRYKSRTQWWSLIKFEQSDRLSSLWSTL